MIDVTQINDLNDIIPITGLLSQLLNVALRGSQLVLAVLTDTSFLPMSLSLIVS